MGRYPIRPIRSRRGCQRRRNIDFHPLEEDENGMPKARLESGGEYIAVSNLYSQVSTFGDDANQLLIRARFQLTWSFPEVYDTDGLEHFIPVLKVTDKPCNEGETTPCFSKISGLGSNAWSLDNDFRFYTEPGHIKAVELRDGTNHYNDEAEETLIGSGQALRVTGRASFSEDETPAPPGAFDVVFGDFDHVWRTSPRDNGEFSLDLLVPAVNSGHLDLRLRLDDLPGLAQDETNPLPRVRFAVDSSNPTIQTIMLNEVPADSPLSIGEANSLQVMLETVTTMVSMDNPAVLHYRIRAGEAEISRGATALPETLPFGDQFFWTGEIDLTDMGATMLLPSYVVDVVVRRAQQVIHSTRRTTTSTNHLRRGHCPFSDRVFPSRIQKQKSNGAIQAQPVVRPLNLKSASSTKVERAMFALFSSDWSIPVTGTKKQTRACQYQLESLLLLRYQS